MRMQTLSRLIAAGTVVLFAPSALALEIQERTSPGGTDYWLVEEPSIPMVAVEIEIDGGTRLEDPSVGGVGQFMAGLMDEGAGDLDAIAFSRRADEISARFGFSAGRDSVSVSARFLVETLDESVDLLHLALTEPRFDAEPVERVRRQILAGMKDRATDPGAIAGRAFFARAYPDHAYGRPAEGTEETIAAITVDDLRAAHGQLLSRSNAHVALVGAIDGATADRIVDALLDGLPEGAPIAANPVTTAPPPGLHVVTEDVPQSVAMFGQPAIPRDDPDFIPAYVMNYILGGGGFTSRLMTEVREKRGLAYSAYSYIINRDEASLHMGGVQTANARMAESLEVVRDEWRKMFTDGVTAEELDAAKRYLTGAFPLRFDSNAKIAGYLVFLQREGLGTVYLDERNSLIEAVTLDDIRRVAGRIMDPEKLSIVVVGNPVGL